MPKYLSIFAILSIFLLASCQKKEANKFVKIPKAERVEAMAQQEFEMTKDPELGYIPRERLYKTLENINQFQNKSPFGLTWDERGPNNVGGRTRGVMFDAKDPTGNTIWAGGVAGGLWKCNNAYGNYSWEHIDSYNGNVAVSCIIQNPNDLDEMYVGTGEGWFNADAYQGNGIYKSTDGGLTWNQLESTNNEDFNYIQKLVLTGDHLFACTRSEGIQVSTDGGTTWKKSLGNGVEGFSNRAADLELTSDGTLWAAMGIQTQDGVYKSTDLGETWTYQDLEIEGEYERIDLATAPSNPDVVYGLVQAGSNAVETIIKTLNGGLTWEYLEGPPAFNMQNFARNQAWYDLSIGIDPNNENRLFIGGVDILASQNGGNSWNQISQWYGGGGFQYAHADQHNVTFLEGNSQKVIFANDGGLFITENGMANAPSLKELNEGYNTLQFYACATHPDPTNDYFIAGTQDNGTHVINNLGLGPTMKVTGGDGAYCHIDQDNPNIQISSYVYNAYYVTLDNWNSFEYYGTDETEGSFINPTDYDDVHDKLYAAGASGYLNVLDIHSGNIDKLKISNITGSNISAVTVSPFDPETIYIGTSSGRIVKITEVSTNVKEKNLYVSSGNIRSIQINPVDPKQIIATVSNFGVESVLVSSGNEALWVPSGGNLPDIPVRWGIFNPQDPEGAILGTDLGVWTTSFLDGGNTQWFHNSNGLPLTRIDMLDVRKADNLLVAATHGRGLFTSSSLTQFQAYFSSENTLLSEGSDTQDMDGLCKTIHQDSFPFHLSDTYNEDLSFDVSIGTNQTAIAGVDYDLLTNDFTIPIGDTTGWIHVNIYDDMLVNENKFVQIIAKNTSAGLSDSTNLVINNDDLDLDITKEKIKLGVEGIGRTNIDGGQTAIIQANDSLIVRLVAGNQNVSECVSASIIHSGFHIEKNEEYKHFGKLVYFSNEIENNNYTMTMILNDKELDSLSKYSEDYMVFYHPDSIVNTEDVDWTYYATGEFNDFGFNKNGIDFASSGAGTYTIGVRYFDTDEDGFYGGIDDCNDDNFDINPASTEVPYNGVDDDCNAMTLDDDLDMDGFDLVDDCDDTNEDINPDAIEIPNNGIDEDCDGADLTDAVKETELTTLYLYPNPSSDQMTISGISGAIVSYDIFTIEGNVILSGNNKLVDLSQIHPGVYIIRIKTTSGITSRKIIKNE